MLSGSNVFGDCVIINRYKWLTHTLEGGPDTNLLVSWNMTHTLEGGPDTNVTNVFVTNVSGYKANRAGKTNRGRAWYKCLTHTLEGGPDTNVTNVFVTNVSGYKN